MELVIDMGNTRLKWALFNTATCLSRGVLVNTSITSNTLHEQWRGELQPSVVGIACVSDESLFISVKTSLKALWPNIEIIRFYATAACLGVQNAYEQPEKLGVDRWLALLATHHDYQGCACIIDCGTAITIDILRADGVHLGGYITPGLMLMQQTLLARTGLAGDSLHQSLRAGQTTEAAIYAGTLMAAVGLINTIPQLYPEVEQIILTGGDAATVAQYVSVAVNIDVDLVLRGLILAVNTTITS
ncbi:MAG: type III pantothenate kinase [Methylovulum sp.]|jgi:type III pantothenate kinase